METIIVGETEEAVEFEVREKNLPIRQVLGQCEVCELRIKGCWKLEKTKEKRVFLGKIDLRSGYVREYVMNPEKATWCGVIPLLRGYKSRFDTIG